MSHNTLEDAFNAGYQQALDDSGGQCRQPDNAFLEWYEQRERSASIGWVDWFGDSDTAFPKELSKSDIVDVKFGSGKVVDNMEAGSWYWGDDLDKDALIIAYRRTPL